MADIIRDNNRVTGMAATLNSDGSTPVNIVVDATSHAVMVDDNSTGSDNGGTDAPRDDNRVPVMIGV